MPMTKEQSFKKDLMNMMMAGHPDDAKEASMILSSLAKAKRIGTYEADLAQLLKNYTPMKKEAAEVEKAEEEEAL